MDETTKAAAISGASTVGAALITNEGNKKSQKRAQKANLDFWNLQNEYNNPTSQMARLRAAGLNPNLIYGSNASGASGNAESIAPAKAAEYNIPNPLADIQQFAEHRKNEATTDNLKTQNTVLEADAALKASQTAKTLSEGASAATKAKIDKELTQTSIDASKESLRKLQYESIGADLDKQFKDKSLRERLENVSLGVQIARGQLQGVNLDNALKKFEKELNQLGLRKEDPWYLRIMQKASEKIKGPADKFDNEYKPKVREWFNNKFKN